MHAVWNEKPRLEILWQAGTGIGCVLRAIEAQETVRIHTNAMPPGRDCGRRWPGRKLETSGSKAPGLGL